MKRSSAEIASEGYNEKKKKELLPGDQLLIACSLKA
jgi:hypothetical protein